MKKHFILLALAAPLCHAAGLSCKQGETTNEGVTENWQCTYQGSSLDAAYRAMRRKNLHGIKNLPATPPQRSGTHKWQDPNGYNENGELDKNGQHDEVVTTIKRTPDSLVVNREFLGVFFNPTGTKIHLQRQGGKVLIRYQHTAS